MSETNYNSKRIKGKLRVYHYLITNKNLKSYLPYSVPFSKETLKRTTSQYNFLYIKPNQGSQGKGIVQLKKDLKSGKIIARKAYSRKSFKKISSLYTYVKNYSKNRRLLIQKGIELEKVNGNPYDIRVMVQRKPHGKWVCTGMFTKVGLPQKIVTNYYQGGKIIPLDQVFRDLKLTDKEKKSRYHQLSTVSLEVAGTLSAYQKGMHEMGIDFAFDKKGRLWIIEVNTRRPQFHPLKKISPSMYQRMMSYAKSYGRKSAI